MLPVDACTAVAGQAGKLWKRFRKSLPPSSRDLLAELLLDLRVHILPATHLDLTSNIGRARYDIRGIAELMTMLAEPATSRGNNVTDIKVVNDNRATTTLPTNLPPPDPPPFLPPPAPPSLPGLHSAIACADLEAFRSSLFGTTAMGHEVPNDCLWVGSGQVYIDESSMVFTLGAQDFTDTNDKVEN